MRIPSLLAENILGTSKDDFIEGSQAANVLVGNGGNDTLQGLSGADILIGGQGADLLRGGGGEDILISGQTLYDTQLAQVRMLLLAWNSQVSLSKRVQLLRNSAQAPLQSGQSVLNDAAIDSLFGDSEFDWLFVGGGDLFSNLAPGEILDVLP